MDLLGSAETPDRGGRLGLWLGDQLRPLRQDILLAAQKNTNVVHLLAKTVQKHVDLKKEHGDI